ncbi:MAG: hypothetical protein EA393_10880 [Bacteroidetes bacterium]|nr:MAG: hypothetical protein EA393_10880 [Bacteroidota bacterium]
MTLFKDLSSETSLVKEFSGFLSLTIILSILFMGCNQPQTDSKSQEQTEMIANDKPNTEKTEVSENQSDKYDIGQMVPVGSNNSFNYKVISWEGSSNSVYIGSEAELAEPGKEFWVLTLAYINNLNMDMDLSIPSNFIIKNPDGVVFQPRVLNLLYEDIEVVFNGRKLDLYMFTDHFPGNSTLEKSLVYELPEGSSGLRLFFGNVNKHDDRYVVLH